MKLTKYHKEAIVRAITADIPEPDTSDYVEKVKAFIYKNMSKECRALFRKSPASLATAYLQVPNRVSTRTYVRGDVDNKQLQEYVSELNAPFRKRTAALTKLEAAVTACNTRKQFVDTFPEFSNYAPPEEGKCTTLPAVANVVAELIKVGFVPKVTKFVDLLGKRHWQE
jgi:hypothetical protein